MFQKCSTFFDEIKFPSILNAQFFCGQILGRLKIKIHVKVEINQKSIVRNLVALFIFPRALHYPATA